MTKDQLIQSLIKQGYLKTPLIIEAFKAIDRKDFVLPEYKDNAYVDAALPIGYGQTISQPLTVAFMLELLQPQPGDIILDVGYGSGWKAALLAYCVSQSRIGANPDADRRGMVISIERIAELKEMAENNIAKYDFISRGIVKILLRDGSKPVSKEYMPKGGFDKIIASASVQSPRRSASSQRESAAKDEVLSVWKDQLKIGGRIVTPLHESVFVFEKASQKEYREKEYFGFSFVPLIEE